MKVAVAAKTTTSAGLEQRLADWPSSGAISTLSPRLAQLADHALYAPLRAFLARPGKEVRARVSRLAYRLSGGQGEPPPALPSIVECLHAGSLIVDDIEDASLCRRGEPCLHRQVGVPLALNAGNALYFMPSLLIEEAGLSAEQQLLVHRLVGRCLLRCHEGQALDLTVRLQELRPGEAQLVARGISERKTGALVGLAAALGAVAAGASAQDIDALHAFGVELGVGLQMLDDVSGVINPSRADKGIEDLREGRATWVWAMLERELPAESYQVWLESACSATTSEAHAALLDRMRFPLSMRGPERVRAHLDWAHRELDAQLDITAMQSELTAELRRLERRFLEG